jgi:hypothetical protein
MQYARVVGFNGVSDQRMEELRDRISEDPRPDDIPASEIMILHDSDGQRALAILFFENEEDYARGDAALNAMPSDDTPGGRTSVDKYAVAMRMTATT